jgi:hypothetical protein
MYATFGVSPKLFTVKVTQLVHNPQSLDTRFCTVRLLFFVQGHPTITSYRYVAQLPVVIHCSPFSTNRRQAIVDGHGSLPIVKYMGKC